MNCGTSPYVRDDIFNSIIIERICLLFVTQLIKFFDRLLFSLYDK
jgi:hypothetical protein